MQPRLSKQPMDLIHRILNNASSKQNPPLRLVIPVNRLGLRKASFVSSKLRGRQWTVCDERFVNGRKSLNVSIISMIQKNGWTDSSWCKRQQMNENGVMLQRSWSVSPSTLMRWVMNRMRLKRFLTLFVRSGPY